MKKKSSKKNTRPKQDKRAALAGATGSRKSTGVSDKNGTPIMGGDTLAGWFSAPWDEEEIIRLKFMAEERNGVWMACGVESNHEDALLVELAHILFIANTTLSRDRRREAP